MKLFCYTEYNCLLLSKELCHSKCIPLRVKWMEKNCEHFTVQSLWWHQCTVHPEQQGKMCRPDFGFRYHCTRNNEMLGNWLHEAASPSPLPAQQLANIVSPFAQPSSAHFPQKDDGDDWHLPAACITELNQMCKEWLLGGHAAWHTSSCLPSTSYRDKPYRGNGEERKTLFNLKL